MTLLEFIQNNFSADLPELGQALLIALIIILIYDFYHMFYSAVFTWFKK